MLTLYRFVDRDMFMQYQGGGVGHKYMRDIESKDENMSRTCLHGKQVRHKPDSPQTDDEGSGDEAEDTVPPSTLASDDGGSKSDDEDDEDVDLSKGSSCSGESINSDKVASDDNGYDSYSLAEP